MLESIAWSILLMGLGAVIAIGVIVAILMMSGDQ